MLNKNRPGIIESFIVCLNISEAMPPGIASLFLYQNT
jgi:hypothetical protein